MYQPRQIVHVEKSGGRTIQGKGFFRSTYDALTAEENSAMVKSVAAFAVGTAFLASSWAEFLLPPTANKRFTMSNRNDMEVQSLRAAQLDRPNDEIVIAEASLML